MTSRARALARRLAAAVVLLAILAVPPTLLLHFAGSPLAVPDSLRGSQALTSQTDDGTVIWILGVVAWVAWARLLACLALEAITQVRGTSLRMPLPGLLLGADRLLASHLIAALLMTTQLGSNAGPNSPSHLAAHNIGAVQLTRAAATSPVPGVATPPNRPTAPSHAAERAQREVLRPAASIDAPASTHGQRVPSATKRLPIECTVLPPSGRHHDTLWDIAERHLGDGLRWREIFALNDGRLMPDGERLTDASLIRPGWILRLPADATMLPVDQVRTSHPSISPAPDSSAPIGAVAGSPVSPGLASPPVLPPALQAPAAVPSEAQPDVPPRAAPPAQTPEANQPPTAPATTSQPTPSREATDHEAHVEPHNGDENNADLPVASLATLGSLLLAASALLASLTRRRKLAARRRPPGVRATRPAPEVLDAERRLRRQAHRADDISATIRLALLVAAKTDQPLTVLAVWEHPDGTLELVLPDPHPTAPTPFEATARGWQLTSEGQRFLFAVRVNGSRKQDRSTRLDGLLQQTPDPFPALLPVGTAEGSACLVNLEPLGLISLGHHQPEQPDRPQEPDERVPAGADQGHDDWALPARPDAGNSSGIVSPDLEAILQAWAQAFAGAPWAELTHLYLPGHWADIATGLDQVSASDLLDPNRSAGLRSAVLQLQPDEGPVASLQAARATAAGGGDTIRLNVSIGYTPQTVPAWLPAAASDPLDANVLLLAGHHPDAHQWTVNADGTVTIPGITDRLQPLRLDPDEHALQLRLLEHAEDPPHAEPNDPQRAELLAQCPPQAPVTTSHASEAAATPEPAADQDMVIDLTDGQALTQPSRGPADHQPVVDDVPTDAATDDVNDVAKDVPGSDAARTEGGPETEPSNPADTLAPAPPVDAEDIPRPAMDLTVDELPSMTPALPAGPVEVQILGPLEVHGTTLDVPRKQALDVLVYLALHRRPITSDVLFEAVWPDKGFNGRTLRNRVSEVRGYIPPGVDYARGGYQLPDLVQTDWQRFQALAKGDADAQLSALRLVRGRPFEGMTLDWIHLEGHFAEMEAAIVDLALHVGSEALRAQSYDVAREACYAGLRGCPYEERLYRIGMESASARGATAELRELRRRLELVLAEEVDDDLQPATRELYQRLHDEDELRRRRHERQA